MTQLATHRMPTGAGRKGGRAPRKNGRSAPLPTDENRVLLRCNQAIVISGSGNSGTQIVITTPTELRAPLCGVNTSGGYPMSPYPPLQGPSSAYPYSPWLYSPLSSMPPFYGPQSSLPPRFDLHCNASFIGETRAGVHPGTPGMCGMASTSTLCFNISVCSGCRRNFTQFDDLVVRHAEQHMFNSPRTGLPTSKYGNAYYHPKQHCLKVKWGDFQPHDLVIHDNMLLLSTVHKEMLFMEFGVPL